MNDSNFAFLAVAAVIVAIIIGCTAGGIVDKVYAHKPFCTEVSR